MNNRLYQPGTYKIYISILFSLCVILIAHSQTIPYSSEIIAFNKDDSLHPKEKGQIVFVGSSSFTRWKDVQSRFPEYKIINRGFGGSTLIDVFNHASATIYKYEPRQVFIYCGENDFAGDTTLLAMEVFKRYFNLVVEIRNHLPKTEILYVSAKPSPSRWHLAAKFKEFNTLVSQFSSSQQGFKFINVWDAMLNADGLPKPEIFIDDKLHMNKAGYDIWVPILKKYLR